MGIKLSEKIIEEFKGDIDGLRLFWQKQNKQFIGSLKPKTKTELYTLLLEKLFELEIQRVLFDSSKEAFKMQEDLIAYYKVHLSLKEKKSKYDSKKQAEYVDTMLAPVKEQKRKTKELLARGRELGAKKKQAIKLGKLETIAVLLEDLYRTGEGYKMGYKVIADRLVKNIGGYTDSSMLKIVKEIAPPFKKKYKSGPINT